MANDQEKQTIDEIEKTVEELRKKIELLTKGNDNTNESTSIHIEYPESNQESNQEEAKAGKDWVGLIGNHLNDVKEGFVNFANDPKVISAKESIKEKSLNALDQLKVTLHDLKTNENIANAGEKAKDAFNTTMDNVEGWIKDGLNSLNDNPEFKKVIDEIGAGLNKSGEAIKDFVNSDSVQNVLDKAKEGAIIGTQKLADFVKDVFDKE